jgi:hypothetical protein
MVEKSPKGDTFKRSATTGSLKSNGWRKASNVFPPIVNCIFFHIAQQHWLLQRYHRVQCPRPDASSCSCPCCVPDRRRALDSPRGRGCWRIACNCQVPFALSQTTLPLAGRPSAVPVADASSALPRRRKVETKSVKLCNGRHEGALRLPCEVFAPPSLLKGGLRCWIAPCCVEAVYRPAPDPNNIHQVQI